MTLTYARKTFLMVMLIVALIFATTIVAIRYTLAHTSNNGCAAGTSEVRWTHDYQQAHPEISWPHGDVQCGAVRWTHKNT